MKSRFSYHRPCSASAARELKSQLGKNAVYWAGGTDLLLQWQRGARGVEHCIDITHCGMDIFYADQKSIHIGAAVRLSTLEGAAKIHQQLQVLEETAKMMATPQVRTVATVGGNICNAVPSADTAPVLMVLGARLVTTNGEYSIDEFFKGVRKTALAEDELLEEIIIPIKANTAADYQRITRSSVDISLTGAAVAITVDDKMNIISCRIALNAVAPTPVRAKDAEEYLIGKNIGNLSDQELTQAGELALKNIKPISDIRGSIEFRNYASMVTVKRAIRNVACSLKKGVA